MSWLSSIFGGGGGDYGASGDKSSARSAYDVAGKDYGTIGSYGQQQLYNWGSDNNLYRQSAQNLATAYGQDPTAQQKAQVLGTQNVDTATAYAKARARLLSDTANSGLDTAGNQGAQSSVLGGGLANLNAAYANTQAANATNYYNNYESPEAKLARLQKQSDIYGGLQSGEWTGGIGAMNDAAGGYSNIGSGYNRLADLDVQQAANDQSGWNALLGAAGQGIGGYFANRKR